MKPGWVIYLQTETCRQRQTDRKTERGRDRASERADRRERERPAKRQKTGSPTAVVSGRARKEKKNTGVSTHFILSTHLLTFSQSVAKHLSFTPTLTLQSSVSNSLNIYTWTYPQSCECSFFVAVWLAVWSVCAQTAGAPLFLSLPSESSPRLLSFLLSYHRSAISTTERQLF